MIVVLDTNVIISAITSTTGPPAEIRERWESDEFEVATSPDLLQELERVLTYPKVMQYTKLTNEEVETIIERLQESPNLVTPTCTLNVIDDDPDDDRVLECGVAASANYIVSGDKHLLALGEYEGIVILEPRAFIAILALDHPSN